VCRLNRRKAYPERSSPLLSHTQTITQEAVLALRPALQTIFRYDEPLANQLSNAAASISAQIDAANVSDASEARMANLRAAAAAAEVGVILSMSVVKGYVQPKYVAFLRTRLDTITERLRLAAAA